MQTEDVRAFEGCTPADAICLAAHVVVKRWGYCGIEATAREWAAFAARVTPGGRVSKRTMDRRRLRLTTRRRTREATPRADGRGMVTGAQHEDVRDGSGLLRTFQTYYAGRRAALREQLERAALRRLAAAGVAGFARRPNCHKGNTPGGTTGVEEPESLKTPSYVGGGPAPPPRGAAPPRQEAVYGRGFLRTIGELAAVALEGAPAPVWRARTRPDAASAAITRSRASDWRLYNPRTRPAELERRRAMLHAQAAHLIATPAHDPASCAVCEELTRR